MQISFIPPLGKGHPYFCELATEAKNPFFLYSLGKESAVTLYLVLKAIYPAKPSFSFLHVAIPLGEVERHLLKGL